MAALVFVIKYDISGTEMLIIPLCRVSVLNERKIHQATVGFTPINYSDRGLFPFSQDMISMTILTTMMVTIKKY